MSREDISPLPPEEQEAQDERGTCLNCDQDESMHAEDCDMEYLTTAIEEAQGDA